MAHSAIRRTLAVVALLAGFGICEAQPPFWEGQLLIQQGSIYASRSQDQPPFWEGIESQPPFWEDI